jgi:hypothetical protein
MWHVSWIKGLSFSFCVKILAKISFYCDFLKSYFLPEFNSNNKKNAEKEKD